MTLPFDAAVRAGMIRSDVKVDDVGLALLGSAMAAGSPELAEQRQRMIDLVLLGASDQPTTLLTSSSRAATCSRRCRPVGLARSRIR
jgi:hypothetical protein